MNDPDFGKKDKSWKTKKIENKKTKRSDLKSLEDSVLTNLSDSLELDFFGSESENPDLPSDKELAAAYAVYWSDEMQLLEGEDVQELAFNFNDEWECDDLVEKKWRKLRQESVCLVGSFYGIDLLEPGGVVTSVVFGQIKDDLAQMSYTFLNFIGFSGLQLAEATNVAKKLFWYCGLTFSALGEGHFVVGSRTRLQGD